MSLRTSLLTAFAATFLAAGLASAASLPRTAAFPLPAGAKAGPNVITGTGFFITTITIGDDGTSYGLPCFFCAPGSSIAIPFPITIFTPNTPVQIIAQFYSNTYSGTPVITEKTTIGGVLFSNETVEFSSPFGPSYIGYAYFLGTTSNTGAGSILIEATDAATGAVLARGTTEFGVE